MYQPINVSHFLKSGHFPPQSVLAETNCLLINVPISTFSKIYENDYNFFKSDNCVWKYYL